MNTPAIAVFGSSEPVAGDPLYEGARRLGGLLASGGYAVVTGGYGGVMEGASVGAVEAGGRAIGVVCDVFRDREPNPHLTEIIRTADLHERTRMLVDLARGYVAFHGKSGTLAEVACLWALHRAGSLGSRPVILLGDGWRRLASVLAQARMIEPEQFEITRIVDGPEEAVRAIGRSPATRGED